MLEWKILTLIPSICIPCRFFLKQKMVINNNFQSDFLEHLISRKSILKCFVCYSRRFQISIFICVVLFLSQNFLCLLFLLTRLKKQHLRTTGCNIHMRKAKKHIAWKIKKEDEDISLNNTWNNENNTHHFIYGIIKMLNLRTSDPCLFYDDNSF